MAGPSRERMRADFRAAVAVLQAEGWSVAEIEAISPAIRAAEKGEAGLLWCWADWLAEKAAGAVRQEKGVVPVLSLAAEARLADGRWKKG